MCSKYGSESMATQINTDPLRICNPAWHNSFTSLVEMPEITFVLIVFGKIFSWSNQYNALLKTTVDNIHALNQNVKDPFNVLNKSAVWLQPKISQNYVLINKHLKRRFRIANARYLQATLFLVQNSQLRWKCIHSSQCSQHCRVFSRPGRQFFSSFNEGLFEVKCSANVIHCSGLLINLAYGATL